MEDAAPGALGLCSLVPTLLSNVASLLMLRSGSLSESLPINNIIILFVCITVIRELLRTALLIYSLLVLVLCFAAPSSTKIDCNEI